MLCLIVGVLLVYDPPPPCDAPVDCFPCADFNQDGGVDGWDVEAFCAAMVDGLLLDVNGDGCSETDYDSNRIVNECDFWVWFERWEMGE